MCVCVSHLGFDLFGRVGEVDGGLRVAAGHLGLRALQRRDERRVDERRLREPEPRRHVTRHPEIRVLREPETRG